LLSTTVTIKQIRTRLEMVNRLEGADPGKFNRIFII